GERDPQVGGHSAVGVLEHVGPLPRRGSLLSRTCERTRRHRQATAARRDENHDGRAVGTRRFLRRGRGGRGQWAPVPVSDRTSSSAYFLVSGSSLESTVPSQPSRKPAGMEIRPGFFSGNQEKSTSGNIDVGSPETTGENSTRPTAMMRPP